MEVNLVTTFCVYLFIVFTNEGNAKLKLFRRLR